MKMTKRIKNIISNLNPDFEFTLTAKKNYALPKALSVVKSFATVKFNESIDAAINLGIDPKKSDQAVRGSSILPHGTGKTVRVAVFAQGANVEIAKNAGADIVGFEDLAEKIKAGDINFDILIATPDAMRIVSPLGAVLGPRGLMPNPKVGTVSPNVAQAVTNAKGGQVVYRAEKNGIVHVSIGKASFTEAQLQKNLETIITDLKKARPVSAKGIYFKKITLSSTMGPGVSVDMSSIQT